MRPLLVTFDLDDTLWDNRPVLSNAEAAMQKWLEQHAPRLPRQPAEYLQQVRAQLLLREPNLKHRLSELRRRTLYQALQAVHYSSAEAQSLAEQAFQILLEARHAISLFPDALSTLERLSHSYQLGVITNGNADVRRLGLGDYFRITLCAEELGVGKPDAKPFQEALRLSGIDAAQAVHIGDHPQQDIAGARSAGWRSIWFNPAAQDWTGPGQADAEVRCLAELPELLQRWH